MTTTAQLRREKKASQLMSPSLYDMVGELLRERNYTTLGVAAEFDVGNTWYSDVYQRRTRTPDVITLQYMYEKLTGKPLFTK